jgi:hypothetical protein
MNETEYSINNRKIQQYNIYIYRVGLPLDPRQQGVRPYPPLHLYHHLDSCLGDFILLSGHSPQRQLWCSAKNSPRMAIPPCIYIYILYCWIFCPIIDWIFYFINYFPITDTVVFLNLEMYSRYIFQSHNWGTRRKNYENDLNEYWPVERPVSMTHAVIL